MQNKLLLANVQNHSFCVAGLLLEKLSGTVKSIYVPDILSIKHNFVGQN